MASFFTYKNKSPNTRSPHSRICLTLNTKFNFLQAYKVLGNYIASLKKNPANHNDRFASLFHQHMTIS